VTVEIADDVVAKLEQLSIRRGSYKLEPLSRIHKLIATRLTEAARDIPTFPLLIDINVDELLLQRTQFNQTNSARVSVNDLMVKAAAIALKEVPAVNSSFTPHGFVRHNQADIAIAVATKFGLMTPIVFAVEDKSCLQIAAATRDLSDRARAGQLKPDEYTGGTFTISNLGMFGIKSFGSIINPPHAAILSVGAARPTPIAVAGEVRVATITTVTLTCDHRVVDGAMGANWLNAFQRILEQPKQLFA